MKLNKKLASVAVAGALAFSANANATNICSEVSFDEFASAAKLAYSDTSAFGFTNTVVGMWATLINAAGTVCYVYSVDSDGANNGAFAGNDAWLGSRVISAQKANTTNAFSLETLSLPSGSVYALVQPGGSLYGLQHSNPVDTAAAYGGSAANYGTANDPLRGKKIGGVNVFGGGFALYTSSGEKVGAVGVSGDTSCRDSAMAYRIRVRLAGGDYSFPPADDGLVYAATPAAPYEHPICGVNDPTTRSADKTSLDFGWRP
jgi:uncharacterized protein GlcG (DUF336 family)